VPSRQSLARCPSCGKRRDVEKQEALARVEAKWFERDAARYRPDSRLFPLRDGMRRLAQSGEPSWFWACDECIRAKRALVADIDEQNLGTGTPFAAYVDRPFRCGDCGKAAMFSALEQKHWFEELHFLIWVYPKQCAPCRALRRKRKGAQAALADALHGLDEADPDQLEQLARLYDTLGLTAKASMRRAQARKRRVGRG
jgi:hypothetical protein